MTRPAALASDTGREATVTKGELLALASRGSAHETSGTGPQKGPLSAVGEGPVWGGNAHEGRLHAGEVSAGVKLGKGWRASRARARHRERDERGRGDSASRPRPRYHRDRDTTDGAGSGTGQRSARPSQGTQARARLPGLGRLRRGAEEPVH
jgi:hypothetical protein